jgi:hypothetical protein
VTDGVLLDAAGKPLPNISVTIRPEHGNGDDRHARTDEEGAFRFARLRAGNFAITFRQPGVTVPGVVAGKPFKYRILGSQSISGRIKRQEFEALEMGHEQELVAEPICAPSYGRATRRHVALIDREKGTFEFHYLPAGEYRITGELTAGFKGETKQFTVKGEARVEAGAEDLVIRLVFKK